MLQSHWRCRRCLDGNAFGSSSLVSLDYVADCTDELIHTKVGVRLLPSSRSWLPEAMSVYIGDEVASGDEGLDFRTFVELSFDAYCLRSFRKESSHFGDRICSSGELKGFFFAKTVVFLIVHGSWYEISSAIIL